MNSAQLRAFHAVATAGSVTAAGRALRISQPAVTMQIKALERAYGVELFRRRGRGVELTDIGRKLADLTLRAAGVEEQMGELLASAQALRRGTLRLGVDAPCHVLAPLAAFRARYPDLSVTLSVGNSTEILQALFDGRTDVALLADVAPDPRLHAMTCATYRLVAFVARDHRFARRKAVRLDELAGEALLLREEGSMTRRAFEIAARTAGVEIHAAMEVQSREAVRELVAANLGVGVISAGELGHDERLVLLPITGVELMTTEHVVCLEERRKLRIVDAFFELAAPAKAKRRPAT